MTGYLHPTTLFRLLAVLTLVVAPHAVRLPVWETALIAALMLWRVAATWRQWRMPPTVLKAALTAAAFAGVYASYGRVSGQTAGVALLVAMLVLKLTELRAKRDVMVLVFLMYFILITHFLFSQEIWTIAYLFAASVAITALLIDVNHAGGPLPAKPTLAMAGSIVAQSLPLMVLMFVLFPRVPGPLWGLPADSGAARSGLSDSMSPGDISRLIESDEVAFRVRFEGEAPPHQALYWRGPVFWHFDGRAWESGFRGSRETEVPETRHAGSRHAYEVVLEPTRARWLFALDLPDPGRLPPNTRLNIDYQLLSTQIVRERVLYRAESVPDYVLQPALPDWMRVATTRLPKALNPRARRLAEDWRTQAPSDSAIVGLALAMYREQAFFYTLEPPRLGRDSVDDFLFGTRRGFCEHYASSFTYLMRAAGIPARVVTGYQGGTRNALSDYYIVRQSDAHAWSEVWLEGRGWVRIDPTAAVAPSRIERGIDNALGRTDRQADFLAGRISWIRLQYEIEARWDLINASWNRWVLAYGPELQQQLLGRFGLVDWRSLVLALTFCLSAALAVAGVLLMRRAAPPRPRERAVRLWRTAQKRLARKGLVQRPGEGPRDFAERVIRARPALEPAMRRALNAYLRLRYSGESGVHLERQLAAAVASLARR